MKGFWKGLVRAAVVATAIAGSILGGGQEANAELYPPTPDYSQYCSGPCHIELPAPSELKRDQNIRNYSSYNSYQPLNIQVYQPISYAAPQLQRQEYNYIPNPTPIRSGAHYDNVVQLENNYIRYNVSNFQTPQSRSYRVSYNYSRQNFRGGQRRSYRGSGRKLSYQNYATPSRRHYRR